MRRAVALLAICLASAGAVRADERQDPLEKLDKGDVHHRVASKHGRKWSLYVPGKYSDRSSWPLVVTIHGRGGSGEKEIRAWQSLGDDHGFLVAAPDMVTATNPLQRATSLSPAEEDDEVLMAIVEEIREAYRVNPRAVMITGFSGGGNPSYHSGLRHPEVFTHIVTRGGNFAPAQAKLEAKEGLEARAAAGLEAVEAAGRRRLQEAAALGEKDAKAAERLLREVERDYRGLAVSEEAKRLRRGG